jgi:acetoin utilization deacetylase AcuC-like enzyme
VRVQILYCDHFVLPLPEGHRFPMAKYAMLRARVVSAGLGDSLVEPPAATDEQLLRVHDTAYIERVKSGTLSANAMRRLGFPWSAFMVERSRRSVGGTIAACRAALADGVAVNLAGGTHHAFADRGEGFCVFNDAVVAARDAQHKGLAGRVVIIDLDVHQGDGTATLCADDPTIFTLSVHGERNYPLRKARSDLDIGLPDDAADDEYLAAVDHGVRQALADSRADLAIYLAGADPFVGDRLGRLAVTKEGLQHRDEIVLDRCGRAGVPVAIVMSGGYATPIDHTVDIHFATVAAAEQHTRARVATRAPISA